MADVRANGDAVRALRERSGFRAGPFARLVGISPSYLSDIETGRKPGSPEVLLAMARVLKVPVTALVENPEVVAS